MQSLCPSPLDYISLTTIHPPTTSNTGNIELSANDFMRYRALIHEELAIVNLNANQLSRKRTQETCVGPID